jgi:hypothetical protein
MTDLAYYKQDKSVIQKTVMHGRFGALTHIPKWLQFQQYIQLVERIISRPFMEIEQLISDFLNEIIQQTEQNRTIINKSLWLYFRELIHSNISGQNLSHIEFDQIFEFTARFGDGEIKEISEVIYDLYQNNALFTLNDTLRSVFDLEVLKLRYGPSLQDMNLIEVIDLLHLRNMVNAPVIISED